MNNKDKHRYDYMLNKPHHQSSKRKQMTMIERAAQFGAFRALSGYEDVIEETGRLTDRKIELDEYEKQEIDLKLQYILENCDKNMTVKLTYFMNDHIKDGGEYISYSGIVKRILENEKIIVFQDGQEVLINNILNLTIV